MQNASKIYQSCGVILLSILVVSIWNSIHWLTYVGLALGVLVMWFPTLATMIDYLWMGLGKIMGRIVSPIVLAFVYFGILWPISLFSKRARIHLMLDKKEKSTFIKIDESINREFFERTW